MDLDWITLYDYMSIFSRAQIKLKVNKFYEAFYPLKLKKLGRKQLQIMPIQRVGLLGIVATYIQKMLFALKMYLEAQYFINQGKVREQIKLCKVFIQIEEQNLITSLNIEQTVYIISELYKIYTDKREQVLHQKSFLIIKLLVSLNRIFEFVYSLHQMRDILKEQGLDKLFETLKIFSVKVCEKSLIHVKLFPQIGEVLTEILHFFLSSEKESFNFHSHLTQENATVKKRSYPLGVKKLFAVIPNQQKTLFVNLSDENFLEYLTKSGLSLHKELIQNYFRSEEQINSLVAEEQNFIQGILVSQKFRGKSQWKKKATEQLVNLSYGKQKGDFQSKLHNIKQFRQSEDYPLYLF